MPLSTWYVPIFFVEKRLFELCLHVIIVPFTVEDKVQASRNGATIIAITIAELTLGMESSHLPPSFINCIRSPCHSAVTQKMSNQAQFWPD
jgi:hypothetical protein